MPIFYLKSTYGIIFPKGPLGVDNVAGEDICIKHL